MLAWHTHRLPRNILNIAHKHERSVASHFSSLVPWCAEVSERDENTLNQNGTPKRAFKFVIDIKAKQPSSFLVPPILFRRYKTIYRMYGTYSNEFFHNDVRFFSTTATPPSNNEPTLKSESKGQDSNTSIRREKAKKLARTGATKARKGGSKVRELLSKYGWYFGGTYFSIYLVTLSSFYTALDTGFLDPSVITSFWGGDLMGHGEEEVDAVKMVASLLEKWDLTAPYSESVEQNPKLTQLGVAWLATKIIEPARIAVAVFVTPKIANALGDKRQEGKEENTESDNNKK